MAFAKGYRVGLTLLLGLCGAAGLATAGLTSAGAAAAAEFSRAANAGRHFQFTVAPGRPDPQLKQTAFSSDVSGFEKRSDTVLARRWSRARARLAAEAGWLSSCGHGACRDRRAAVWQRAVARVKSSPRHGQPALVQAVLSQRLRYVRDSALDDHWANPLATLLSGAGDCEDHVLLKRALLVAAGYREDTLRLIVLETAQGQGHMVLQITGDQSFVLDNRSRYPVPAEALKDDRVVAVATGAGFFLVQTAGHRPGL